MFLTITATGLRRTRRRLIQHSLIILAYNVGEKNKSFLKELTSFKRKLALGSDFTLRRAISGSTLWESAFMLKLTYFWGPNYSDTPPVPCAFPKATKARLTLKWMPPLINNKGFLPENNKMTSDFQPCKTTLCVVADWQNHFLKSGPILISIDKYVLGVKQAFSGRSSVLFVQLGPNQSIITNIYHLNQRFVLGLNVRHFSYKKQNQYFLVISHRYHCIIKWLRTYEVSAKIQ